VAAAVKSSAWQGSDGIIKEGSSPSKNNDGVGFKGVMISTVQSEIPLFLFLSITNQPSLSAVFWKYFQEIHLTSNFAIYLAVTLMCK